MSFTVYKLNHLDEEELHYTGEVLDRSPRHVCIRAIFSFDTMVLPYVTLKKGDIFTEWFYTNRWYNIFRVEDVDTGELKGFYCNITRPAIISDNSVRAEDLALDVFVKPNGAILLLDEDDYAALNLDQKEQQAVQDAVAEIKALVVTRTTPFDHLDRHEPPLP